MVLIGTWGCKPQLLLFRRMILCPDKNHYGGKNIICGHGNYSSLNNHTRQRRGSEWRHGWTSCKMMRDLPKVSRLCTLVTCFFFTLSICLMVTYVFPGAEEVRNSHKWSEDTRREKIFARVAFMNSLWWPTTREKPSEHILKGVGDRSIWAKAVEWTYFYNICQKYDGSCGRKICNILIHRFAYLLLLHISISFGLFFAASFSNFFGPPGRMSQS